MQALNKTLAVLLVRPTHCVFVLPTTMTTSNTF